MQRQFVGTKDMQTEMQKLQEDISNLPEAMSVAGCGGYDTYP